MDVSVLFSWIGAAMRTGASGLDKKQEALRAMRARLDDMTPAMEAAAQAAVKFVSDRFRSQTDPEGAAWAPLAESTLIQRSRKSAGSIRRNLRMARQGDETGSGTGALFRARATAGVKILQDTRLLANSITAEASPKSFTFGTNVPYAGPHQFGARAGRGGSALIPRRAFFPVLSEGGRLVLAKTGPAKELLDRVIRYVSSYVRTGRVAG